MLLGVKPAVFLARVLVFFGLAYFGWVPIAPHYTVALSQATQAAMWLTESFGPPATRAATTVFARDGGIFYTHRLFPGVHPPGIPGDWVQANMVLLLALMLATPAPTWKVRASRLLVAFGIALCLEVLGLVIAIHATWATSLGPFSARYYGPVRRLIYEFADSFFQSFDTQLFPVMIWAGLHFQELLAGIRKGSVVPLVPAQRQSRAERRRRRRARAEA